jgi:uncharacterized membrane protein
MLLSNLLETLSLIFNSAITDWGSLHPLVIHFPIVLLFIAPFFILAGQRFQKYLKPFYISSFILMSAGTLFIFMATSTGNYAAEPLDLSKEAVATLTNHIELAEQARLIFTILTLIFAGYLLTFTARGKRLHPKMHLWANIIYVVFYFYSFILIINAAHHGGKLVHDHGITSNLYINEQ